MGAAAVEGIDLDFGADGTVSGSTGVNRLHGSYEVRAGTLHVGQLITTRMAGPPQAMEAETRLLAVLAGPLGIVRAGSALSLLADRDALDLEQSAAATD